MEISVHRRWDLRHGTIDFGSEKYTGPGFATVDERGRVEITLEIADDLIFHAPHGAGKFEGQTLDGVPLSADQTWIAGVSGHSDETTSTSTLLASPSMLTVGPDTHTKRAILYIKNLSIIGDTQFAVDGHNCIIDWIPRPSQSLRPQPRGLLSARLLVESPVAKAPRDHISFAEQLCRILTIAQRCPAVWFHAEFGEDAVTSAITQHQTWDFLPQPLISQSANKLGPWVQAVYPNYVAAKGPWSIDTLLEYYWRAAQEPTIEVKFILLSVFMEALKFSWASEPASGLVKDIKATTGLVRGFRETHPGAKNLSFEELLKRATSVLGMTPPASGFTFIDDRNALFHSGESGATQLGAPSSYAALRPKYDELSRNADDVLLRILRWQGDVYRWGATTAETFSL